LAKKMWKLAVLRDHIVDQALHVGIRAGVHLHVGSIRYVRADNRRAFRFETSATAALPMPDAAPVTIATLPAKRTCHCPLIAEGCDDETPLL